MTRQEHLQWCKERSLKELEFYKVVDPSIAIREATTSVISDLRKNPDTHQLVSLAFAESLKVKTESDLEAFFVTVLK